MCVILYLSVNIIPTGSLVELRSLCHVHAALTPVAVQSVNSFLLDLSQSSSETLVLTTAHVIDASSAVYSHSSP